LNIEQKVSCYCCVLSFETDRLILAIDIESQLNMLKDFNERRKKYFPVHIVLTTALLLTLKGYTQTISPDSLLQEANLQNVVHYALKRQPIVQQSYIDEKITELQIKSRLADWYPQIDFNYLYQRNFQVQTSIIAGNQVRLGVNNTSAFQFSASQTIFNRDVLLANSTKGSVIQQARQQTENTKIDVVANVSKAFMTYWLQNNR
jgi:outer membrane protein TolC